MLTGTAGAVILAIAAKLLPLVLAAIARWMLDDSAQEKARQDAIALGAEQTAAAINKETLDAQRRAAEAAAHAPDVPGMLDDMAGGKF